jgi:hypothetical protein
MDTTSAEKKPVAGQSPVQPPKQAKPSGQRVLHVIIDQSTFDLLHIQAIRSQMKFTSYMQRFLLEAFPFNDQDRPTAIITSPTTPSQTPEVPPPIPGQSS